MPVITVPQSDVTAGMVELAGSDSFKVGLLDADDLRQHSRNIAPFYMDPHEVTIKDYRAAFNGVFPGNINPPDASADDFPMTGVTVDYAMWCAERMGKRLITEFEYEFAATNGGKNRFPWGDDFRDIPLQLSSVKTPDFDQTMIVPHVYGLFSNGAEFTTSPFIPYPGQVEAGATKLKLLFPEASSQSPAIPAAMSELTDFGNISIRGGLASSNHQRQASLMAVGVRYRDFLSRKQTNDSVGFRCGRTKSPRW